MVGELVERDTRLKMDMCNGWAALGQRVDGGSLKCWLVPLECGFVDTANTAS